MGQGTARGVNIEVAGCKNNYYPCNHCSAAPPTWYAPSLCLIWSTLTCLSDLEINNRGRGF